jgi:hypothetical protein
MPDKIIRMTEAHYILNLNEYIGICRECGYEQCGCEPDARKYKCEDCGAKQVFGTEELLQMGLIDIEGEDE